MLDLQDHALNLPKKFSDHNCVHYHVLVNAEVNAPTSETQGPASPTTDFHSTQNPGVNHLQTHLKKIKSKRSVWIRVWESAWPLQMLLLFLSSDLDPPLTTPTITSLINKTMKLKMQYFALCMKKQTISIRQKTLFITWMIIKQMIIRLRFNSL